MATSYRPIAPITVSGYAQPVTALSFDPVSDTLWVGSNSGNITAYHGTRGVRGVSFQVGGPLAVSKILAGENYVRAMGVAGEGLGSWTKGGVNKWFCR
jgi:PAB-dependent poly(A)-specific ribonuclease subunit 2